MMTNTLKMRPDWRQRVHFGVADGGDGGQHHVKAVEPGPALDQVETGRAQGKEHQQRDRNKLEIANSFQNSFQSPVFQLPARPAEGGEELETRRSVKQKTRRWL